MRRNKGGVVHLQRWSIRALLIGIGLMLAAAVAAPASLADMPPTVFNPVVEAQNFSITQQRQAIYDTPRTRRSSRPTVPPAPHRRSLPRPPTRGACSPTTCAGT
jgi:hypothetical protein